MTHQTRAALFAISISVSAADCSGGGGGGDGSAALRAGPLMFIRAQLGIYNDSRWQDINGDGYLDSVGYSFPFVDQELTYASFGSETEITGPQRFVGEGIPGGVADFNGDGLNDVACTVATTSRGAVGSFDVVVYFQQPDGSFGDPLAFGLDGEFRFVTLGGTGRFNDDDFADLLVSASQPGLSILVFAGAADGSFTRIGTAPVSGTFFPLVDAVADVNNDGFDDLIEREFTTADDSIFVALSRGDGTFEDLIQTPTDSFARTEPADFNGDGFLDFIFVFPPAGDGRCLIRVQLGDATASYSTFVETLLPNVGDSIFAVAVTGDFNEDGWLDVVLAATEGILRGGTSRVDYIALGNGDGTFATPARLPESEIVAAEDFNHDGHLDLLRSNESILFPMLFGNGDGTFLEESALTFSASFLFPEFETGENNSAPDVDGDGNLDILATDMGPGTLLHYGRGDGTFDAGQIVPGVRYWRGIDLDDDGDLDFQDFDNTAGVLRIWRTYSRDDIRAIPPITIAPGSNWQLDFVEVDGDGHVDIALQDASGIFALYGLGNMQFLPMTRLGSEVLRQFAPPELGDINGDGTLDRITYDESSHELVSQLQISPRTFGPEIRTQAVRGISPVFPRLLLVRDLTGDGRTDVVTLLRPDGSDNTFRLLVYRARANGTFELIGDLALTDDIPFAALGDVDGDGDTDIVGFANNLVFDVSALIFVNDGTGHFQLSQQFSIHRLIPISAAEVYVVDLSGDGMDDIVAMSDGAGLSVSIAEGDGMFRGPYHFATNTGFRAAFGDHDEDGDMDIAATSATSDGVVYLENRTVD